MPDSDTLNITLKLGGKNFSITVKRDEEIFYRNAERLINQRYSFYANRFPDQSDSTYLMMTTIDIAVRLKRSESEGNLQPIMETLTGLTNEIDAAIN